MAKSEVGALLLWTRGDSVPVRSGALLESDAGPLQWGLKSAAISRPLAS